MNFSYTTRLGDIVVDNKNNIFNVDDLLLDKKYVFLLFSKLGCPPCKKLSPILKDIYKNHSEDIEIVWVPADDVNEYNTYFETMPWKSIPLSSNKRYFLSFQLATKGVPQLWLLDGPTGKILSNSIPKITYNPDSKNWLEHFSTLNNDFNWIEMFFKDSIYDSSEEKVELDNIRKKKICLLIFLLPHVNYYEKIVENLNHIYENNSDTIELLFVPDNSRESYEKLKNDLHGVHMQFGNVNIQKLVTISNVMKTGLPVIYPLIIDSGEMKNNVIQKVMYAKETINMEKVLMRTRTMFSISHMK